MADVINRGGNKLDQYLSVTTSLRSRRKAARPTGASP